jgi:hypothetical protein
MKSNRKYTYFANTCDRILSFDSCDHLYLKYPEMESIVGQLDEIKFKVLNIDFTMLDRFVNGRHKSKNMMIFSKLKVVKI